jgi:hypothetical protein
MRRRLLQFGFLVGIVNFFVFFLAALYLGGDGVSGEVIDGHYFLSSHGRLTEVSQAVFMYSEWQMRSVFITHPIGALCAWRLSCQRNQPAESQVAGPVLLWSSSLLRCYTNQFNHSF